MLSPLDLVRAPLSFGIGIAQNAVELGVGAARTAFEAVAGRGGGQDGPLSGVESQPPRAYDAVRDVPSTRGAGAAGASATVSGAATGGAAEPAAQAAPSPLREAPPLADSSATADVPAPAKDVGRPASVSTPATADPAVSPLADEHVDTESVLVAAVAEEGAQDGAGPELHVDEPWEGYGAMNAPDIRDRLQTAGRETLAAVELYEGLHKERSSVLEAASRRLEQLS